MEAINVACLDWKANGWRASEGNDRFFQLGLRLVTAGIQEPELVEVLRAETIYANTPEDRLRQIPSIIGSLRRYGHLAG